MITSRFELNTKGFRELERLNGGSGGAWQTALKQMAKRYSGYTIRWCESEGEGTWAPLKETTKKRRRKGGAKGGRERTLQDTGTLINSLAIGDSGNFIRFGKTSVEYGFGDVPHGGGDMTIRKLAVIHQEGNPDRNLPARPIFVVPPKNVQRAMLGYVKNAEQRMMRRASRKVR